MLEVFSESVKKTPWDLKRGPLTTLQVNLGKLCNQACHHCHVEAGPKRTEIMNGKVTDRVIELLAQSPEVGLVDLTGGAPEMMPHFRRLVTAVREMGKRVIDRCNLSILFEEGFEDLAQFLADNQVEIVASLPCYSKENVDKQRGRGVFDKSVEGLELLNDLGYGKEGSPLKLDLVYNPGGPFLPPGQMGLQAAYKKELKELFDIEFHSLLTITNMPIKRFLKDLQSQGKEEEYQQLLIDSFNSDSVEGLMCRSLVSVGWDGQIYDCDFNQMLDMPVQSRRSVFDIEKLEDLLDDPVVVANHCYGCTAGAGSSCGGALV